MRTAAGSFLVVKAKALSFIRKLNLMKTPMKAMVLMACFVLGMHACEIPGDDPNEDTYGAEVANDPKLDATNETHHSFVDSVYVPVYSDIYSQGKHIRFLLTSTLSIRSTSYTDTIAVRSIEYFDTRGKKVTDFLKNPIYVLPMATVEYVIDEEDISGGSGANFMVVWSAKDESVKAVIQAVMISVSGQQGVAFRTDGVSISKKKQK